MKRILTALILFSAINLFNGCVFFDKTDLVPFFSHESGADVKNLYKDETNSIILSSYKSFFTFHYGQDPNNEGNLAFQESELVDMLLSQHLEIDDAKFYTNDSVSKCLIKMKSSIFLTPTIIGNYSLDQVKNSPVDNYAVVYVLTSGCKLEEAPMLFDIGNGVGI